MNSRKVKPTGLATHLCLQRSEDKVCPGTDVGACTYLRVAASAAFPRAAGAGPPAVTLLPPRPPPAGPAPPPGRSAGLSPGQAAGTEGLRASPPRRPRCGSTGLFWRWRHLAGEHLLSVQRFLIKKKKKLPSVTQQKGVHSSSHEWAGCMVLKQRPSKV